jgi:RND superfamily putative drug exporter
VILSYLSALGIGTIVFQFGLHQELHWTVPGLTFIILVAVGADYNLLLISRIRDESPHGIRVGVIRTVGSTGGVITAAGLIFAASMFGLLFASISMMVQAGFVLGTGILLDTFLVRTVTVPAIATLIGKGNWWPSKPQQHQSGATATAKHLARLRKALRPKYFGRQRRGTLHPAENLPLSVDDPATTDDAEPPVVVDRVPLERDSPQNSKRDRPLVYIRRSPIGRRLRR